MKSILLVCSIYCFAITFYNFSQIDTTQIYKIVTEKKTFYGKVIKDDGREILIETNTLGKLYLNKNSVLNISIYNSSDKDLKNNEVEYESELDYKYFTSISAKSIKKGRNVTQINLWGPEIHVGLGKGFVVSFLSTWLASPFGLGVKKTFLENNKNWKIGTGLIFGTFGYWNSFKGNAGMFYANSTYEKDRFNFTLTGAVSFFKSGQKKNYEIEYYETSFDPNVIEDYISKYNLNTYYIRPYEPAFFINIASIFKLSPKISFFIDLNNSLAVVSKPKELIEGKSLNSSYYGNYSLKDEDIEKEYRFVCLVQPGMRYKYKENAVFQFTASVLNVSDELIPIPQISWIFSLK